MADRHPESEAAPKGTFKQDLLASIVVFLVALPLCMGIAIASGVPVAAGLITGMVGGIVAGSLSGCPLQVSGPAAGLTVIVFEIVQEFGFEMLGIVVLMAGACQLAAGSFRLGQWFRAISPAVIKGMLAGIGVLIFASQFHVMVDDKPKGSGLTNLLTIPQAVAKAFDIPKLGSADKRRFRTHALRDVAELHRRQAAIAERVAEVLPDHASEEELTRETPQQIAAEAAALREILPQQQALTEDVRETMARLADFELRVGTSEQSDRIIAATRPAVDRSEVALLELSEGHVRNAMHAQTAAVEKLDNVSAALKNHAVAAQIGLLTILTILLWQGFAPKRIKFIPAPLVAIILAAGVATVFALPVLFVEVPDNLIDEIHFPTRAMLADAPWSGLIQAALVVAMVASAETLLCATAVDQMHQGPRTRYDKELVGQGVGNIVCGALGALPMTGVIVRSSANVQSGGKTRLSAILHGIWLLVFVVFLTALLRLIPTSGLAAILVYTGYKLFNVQAIKQLGKFGWGEVAIYTATVVTIVVFDLLTGVLVGVAMAALKLLHTFSRLDTELNVDPDNREATLGLKGAATFVRLPKLASALEQVPQGTELHVDFHQLDYIDHACLDLLMSWAQQHEAGGGKLVLDWASLNARFTSKAAGATDVPVPVQAGAEDD